MSALAVADPQQVANTALARVNSNASRNSYLKVDETWTSQEAALLRQRGPRPEQLLYGLPIALKDCFDLEGFITSSGSRFYERRNAPAAEDSWVASRLKAAGAVITGKTHMQMLAYGITGENRDYGDCVQPADAASLTGGSSSGSAAAVQEGSAVAAIGTDTGGSIRAPAALCGLTGYRSSLGTGDWRGGEHLAQSFDTIGWLCHDLRDLPQLAAALFNLHPAPAPHNNPQLAVVSGSILADCDASVLASMNDWKERLLRSGANLGEIQPDFFHDAYSIYAPLQAVEAARLHAGFFDEFEPPIAARLHRGASLTSEEVAGWRTKYRAFVHDLNALFSDADFLLMPAVPVPRLIAGEDQTFARPRILGLTTPGSLGGLPAVILPGRPGVQLLAARGNDTALLQLASQLGHLLAAEQA